MNDPDVANSRTALGDDDRRRTIMLVYGRSEGVRRAMVDFLASINLRTIEWDTGVHACESGAPFIGEVVEKIFGMAQAVVVLLTPDDEVRMRLDYLRPSDAPFETSFVPQPRPNVFFEAGIAFGKYPNATVMVEFAPLRPFSDFAGRHVVQFDGSPQKRHMLAERLKKMGCAVDTSGSDWLTAGNFDVGFAELHPRSTPDAADDQIGAIRAGLRRAHELRSLEPLEEELPLNELPPGVFGFVVPWSIGGRDPESLTLTGGTMGTSCVEVHKLLDGSIRIVGFVTPEDSAKIRIAPDTQTIHLFPEPWNDANALQSIAVERIVSARNRHVRGSSAGVIDLVLAPDSMRQRDSH